VLQRGAGLVEVEQHKSSSLALRSRLQACLRLPVLGSNGSKHAAAYYQLVRQHRGGRPAPAQLGRAEHFVQVLAGESGNEHWLKAHRSMPAADPR